MTVAEHRPHLHGNDLRHHHGDGVAVANAPEAGKARDHVCGMTVNIATAKYHSTHNGADRYFCSGGCQTKFDADPDKYLKPRAPAPTPHAQPGVIYTCPMHPQIRQAGPGSCPICGMALEPIGATAEGAKRRTEGHDPPLLDRAVLAVPVHVLEMGGHFPGLGLHHYVSPQVSIWIQFAPRDAGRAVGRLAVLRARLGVGRAIAR